MGILFKNEIVKERLNQYSEFNCNVVKFEDSIELNLNFKFRYVKYSKDFNDDIKVQLKVDTITGDFFIEKEITTKNSHNSLKRKNSFLSLSDITEETLTNGQRNKKFWGKKYENTVTKVLNEFEMVLLNNFDGGVPMGKNDRIDKLYKLITDFHLHKKGIKPHDGVYFSILFDYPTKKNLISNDYKYLPSVLEKYEIKNKYFVSEINKNPHKEINLGTLKYLTSLLGDNYIEIIKEVNFLDLCEVKMRHKKVHQLKTIYEKKCVISLLKIMLTKKEDDILNKVYKLLELREFLQQKGMNLKLISSDLLDYHSVFELWSDYKKIYNRGYLLEYEFPLDYLSDMEQDIVHDDRTYQVRILKSEEDFRNEGHKMKNCLNTHFNLGLYYVYFTITNDKKVSINVQVQRNKINSMYGKTNTDVTEDFIPITNLLLTKNTTHQKMVWKTIKIPIEKENIE